MNKDKNGVATNCATLSEEFVTPHVQGEQGVFSVEFYLREQRDFSQIYRLRLSSEYPAVPNTIKISWQLPATNVKGVWTSGSLYEKRLRADWESADIESSISVNAPALSVFGHQDENRITFACSNAIYPTKLSAPIREEDNLLYCSISLFSEDVEPSKAFEADIYIDSSPRPFSDCLQDIGLWWEAALGNNHAKVPSSTSDPVYSTWYAYHQHMTTEELLHECTIAKDLGYKTIIVDDGWQTHDGQRGYDFTGDWEPKRFPGMANFVAEIHQLGMQCMLWYSVPFCGVKSKAYQQFKGKFLTENHRWAPVFDPRYPEVRKYLVGKYTKALEDWNLDGFKLDFIDDFKLYPETPLGAEQGRDFASVNLAVDQLIEEITQGLKAIHPTVLIEFRQKYVGPRLKKIGNMFRAFDCPNDSATNRLRTTDVRLLAGSSKVHSDMITWHPTETTELAALQLNNILFSVPQISVRLAEQSVQNLRMIRFYTNYFNTNRALLMNGYFRAYGPLENYPILSVSEANRIIFGCYADRVIPVQEGVEEMDIINGHMGEEVVLKIPEPLGQSVIRVYDCQGSLSSHEQLLPAGVHAFRVPPSGMLTIRPLRST